MHRIKLIILLLFVLLFLVACGQKPRIVEKTDDIGYRTVYRLDPKTELREGMLEVFDSSGNLIEQAEYRQDKINGKRIIFSKEGDTAVVETHVDGVFEGPYRTYHEGGQQVRLRGQYAADVMTGQWYVYHPNGQMAEEVTFVDNNENGPFREWFPNGNLKAEGNYRNGDNEHGRLRVYNEDGSLNRVMDCEDGNCSSIWRDTYDTPPPPRDDT